MGSSYREHAIEAAPAKADAPSDRDGRQRIAQRPG
jgi:hypothetical protein